MSRDPDSSGTAERRQTGEGAGAMQTRKHSQLAGRKQSQKTEKEDLLCTTTGTISRWIDKARS